VRIAFIRCVWRARRFDHWLILCAVFIAFAAGPNLAHAQQLCLGTRSRAELAHDQGELRKLLNERNFEALEAQFSERQTGYERGIYDEEKLYYSYQTFDTPSSALPPLLQEWSRRYPKSRAARVALAINQIALGSAARGHALSAETSDEQTAAMRKFMSAARANLRASFALTAKPTMAYAAAIDVERFIGAREGADQLLAKALKVAPDSVYVRQRYFQAIDPRWLGTVADITKALNEIGDSDLPESSQRFLKYETTLRLGGAFLTFKQYELAAELYREAVPYCVLAEPWRALAELYNETGQWREAVDALGHYLAIEPGQAWALRREAYAQERLGDWEQAIPLYRDAAERGDDYAENAYGWSLYEGRHVKRDLDAAITWFQASARQGNEKARINLERALREKAQSN